MKRRILSFLLCAALFVPILLQTTNITSSAAKYEDNVIWEYDGYGNLVISGSGKMSDFEAKGAPWYGRFNTLITNVIVKNGVTSVGEYAFYDCPNIKIAEIADSVTNIGKFAFRNCTGLTSVKLPAAITSIEEFTFYNCKNLKTVDIPERVTAINESAFYECENLENVKISYGLKHIGANAFNGCKALTNISIPNSVTTIETGAFRLCSSLQRVTIPSSVTNIAKDVFQACYNVVIECSENSAAHKYAVENNIKYELVPSVNGASNGNAVMYFSDVPTDAWYYADLKAAFDAGLINGKTFMEFKPNDNMTYAEAIKLAACLHQLNSYGWITLKNGNPWYQPYVDYCKSNKIIDRDYVYTALATRAGYMSIFAQALPAEKLNAINRVDDDAIPDVKMTDYYAAGVYKLYRAGVVGGSDTAHNCRPTGNIKRAEVATILARMMFPDKRIKFTLEKKATIQPTGLRLDYNKTVLVVGETDVWTATVYPNNADPSVTWVSSNHYVATVDQNGKITAIRPGTARITVMTENGIKEAATVTVVAQ